MWTTFKIGNAHLIHNSKGQQGKSFMVSRTLKVETTASTLFADSIYTRNGKIIDTATR